MVDAVRNLAHNGTLVGQVLGIEEIAELAAVPYVCASEELLELARRGELRRIQAPNGRTGYTAPGTPEDVDRWAACLPLCLPAGLPLRAATRGLCAAGCFCDGREMRGGRPTTERLIRSAPCPSLPAALCRAWCASAARAGGRPEEARPGLTAADVTERRQVLGIPCDRGHQSTDQETHRVVTHGHEGECCWHASLLRVGSVRCACSAVAACRRPSASSILGRVLTIQSVSQ